MGNSFCQCNNYFNKNIIGIMKKSDISLNDMKQKANNNNLLKLEEKNPENNTNINTNNNDLLKIQESNEMSKINKGSKDNLNLDKDSGNNYKNIKDDNSNNNILNNDLNNNEEEEEAEEIEEHIEKNSKEKGNELNNVFDNLMNSYAEYISDTEFENIKNQKIIEIEKSLKTITKENDKIKELINDKIFDKPALIFNSNKYLSAQKIQNFQKILKYI